VTLSTSVRWLGTDEMEAICKLDDPVYRNCWITYGYSNVSERLHEHIGENASWCTFARWSSATIGQSLRLHDDSERVDELFAGPLLGRFRSIAQDFYRDVRLMSDGALPRMLALGNHYVFHEIAFAIADLVEWYEGALEERPDATDEEWKSAWTEYRAHVTAFRKADEIFREADIQWLHDGLESYFRAMRCTDPAQRSQLVLRGNILLAAYEQWRVDPILQIALDPFAKHLVEFRSTNPHHQGAPGDYPRAVLRNAGTPWALRHQSSVQRWIADVYASILTRYFMAVEVPLNDLSPKLVLLGRGVPEEHAYGAFGPQRRFDDELTKLVAIFDHNAGDRPRGANNWNSFAERMQFIVELFIALQTNKSLYQPIPSDELALLQLDVEDENLDHLRTVGDPPMDSYVATHLSGGTTEPRDLVRTLIRTGLRPQLGSALPGDLAGTLPPWAQEEKLSDGQRFLREYGLAIASTLFTASLPHAYSAEHGSRVLTATAELASGNVNRRIAETGKMLLDVMTEVAGAIPLDVGSPGSDAVRGVRLFHGAVRQMLLANGWDESRGCPINQEDLLGTLLVFTVVVLDSLEKMGVTVDEATKDSYVHFWMVIGYLLGIDFAMIHRPGSDGTRHAAELTLPELRVVYDAVFRRNARASADGQSLTAALMQLMRETMPRGLRQFPAAATRVLIGDDYGDLLEVPVALAPIRLMFDVARPITRVISGGRLQRAFATPIQHTTERLYRRWITTYHGERPPWEIHDDVKKAMGLEHVEPRTLDRRAAGAPLSQ